MSDIVSPVELFPIVVEGAVDNFCGRPRERNPYCPGSHFEAWDWGWTDAGALLEQRGQEEAAKWLRAA